MNWPHYSERVTVCDVLESGACLDGVVEWIKEHDGLIAGATVEHCRNEHIARATCADGYGYGYRNGYGDGDGDGDGDGYG